MLEIKNTKVYNFDGAFRGMRNPLNSWNKSDSYFSLISTKNDPQGLTEVVDKWKEKDKFEDESAIIDWLMRNSILNYNIFNGTADVAYIGPTDLDLAQRLITAGNEHGKFMRQIFVSMDISAPLYWWKELDTYKVGTTANSTSTMHKLTSTAFKHNMFSFDGGAESLEDPVFDTYVDNIIEMCENLRVKYLETKDKKYWRALVQILPEGFIQTRTWTASYAVLRNIYFQRKGHKLNEWQIFNNYIKTLPYADDLICLGEEGEENE